MLAGLADGSVDVVIGTHRLLTGQVRFKDLGPGRRRRGAALRRRAQGGAQDAAHRVDVLAMSATPIPRTLEMAVTGIREMSTLATPPEERHPVLTFVGAYEEKQITAAIRRELLREGQVFFVHNRVELDRAGRPPGCASWCPRRGSRRRTARWASTSSSRSIVDFWEKKFDVLVCTTIVETGLDISNANTLVMRTGRPDGPVPAAPAARAGSAAGASGPTPTSCTRRSGR